MLLQLLQTHFFKQNLIQTSDIFSVFQVELKLLQKKI